MSSLYIFLFILSLIVSHLSFGGMCALSAHLRPTSYNMAFTIYAIFYVAGLFGATTLFFITGPLR